MKRLKVSLISLVLILALALSACNFGGGGNDNGGGGGDEALDWVQGLNSISDTFAAAENNFTLEVKTITSFDNETELDDWGDEEYSFKNPVYASDLMYTLVIEGGAVMLDAGEKAEVNNRGVATPYSYAKEAAFVDGGLALVNYSREDGAWVAEKADSFTPNYQGHLKITRVLDTVNDAKNDEVKDVLFGGAWNIIYNAFADAGVEYGSDADSVKAQLQKYYSSSKECYVINESIPEYRVIKDGSYYQDIDRSRAYDRDNCYRFFAPNIGAEGYVLYCYNELYVNNISFKLDGNKLSSLSYDVYMTNNGSDFVGLHLDFKNIGTSTISVGDAQVSRADYTGIEASAELIDANKKFYLNGNYTVSYTGELNTAVGMSKNDAQFEFTLMVTPNVVSVYKKYYDLSLEKVWISHTVSVKIDDTTYYQFNFDPATGKWFRRTERVAEGTTTDEALGYYKYYFWNTLESDSDNAELQFSSNMLGQTVSYCDTLKSFVKYSENDASFGTGVDEIKFYGGVDEIYNFDNEGLNLVLTRHKVRYTPDEYQSTPYAEGLLTKMIYDIGDTVIDVPAEFEIAD